MPRPAGEHPQAPLADRVVPRLPSSGQHRHHQQPPGDAQAEQPGTAPRRPQPVEHPVQLVVVVRRHHEQQHADGGTRTGAGQPGRQRRAPRGTPRPAAAPAAPTGTAPARPAGRRAGRRHRPGAAGPPSTWASTISRSRSSTGSAGQDAGPQGAPGRRVEQRPGAEHEQHDQGSQRRWAAASDRDHQPALADAQVQHLLQPGHGRAGGTAAAAQLQRPGSRGRRPPPRRTGSSGWSRGARHDLGLAQVLDRGEGVVDRVPGRLQGDHRRGEHPAGAAGVGAPGEPARSRRTP